MAVSYNGLWKMLIDKGMNKTELRKKIGIGTSTLAKLSANEKVSLDVIEKICAALECDISDVVQIVPYEQEADGTIKVKVPPDILNLDTDGE